MKKLFAATLAAILILSAAGCAKKPVQQEEPAAPVQEEAIVPEAPAEAEKSQDNVRGRSRTRERLEARAAVNGVEKQKRDYDAERLQCGASVDETREAEDARERREAEREMMILRARGVYLEAMEGVPDVVTRVLERIDALLDPRRVEEATMLASWRARYARAVTGRTAARWRDRLFRRVG